MARRSPAAGPAGPALLALAGSALLAGAPLWAQADAPAAASAAPEARASAPRVAEYWVYVACESSDEVYKIRFDGVQATVAGIVDVGYQPTEIEGPHGLAVDPDGKHWYLSIAHGKPFGLVYKYRTDTDELVGETEVGMFPATMEISRATGLLYCANFNLHGRMIPSSISIVDPDAMVEVARTTTGPMPHGSRIGVDGLHHYSCAMMSGHLFELDAVNFAVTRRLQLDETKPEGHDSLVKPTWVDPHPDGKRVFVALNAGAQVAEVHLADWSVRRRFATAEGPYNLEVTPDGKKLVVTYKTAGAVGIWDVASGEELARIPSSRRVTHGVVVSPDNRFAFVTSEGVGGEPGAVDVFDLATDEKVAAVDVGLQAGGIAFWRVVRP